MVDKKLILFAVFVILTLLAECEPVKEKGCTLEQALAVIAAQNTTQNVTSNTTELVPAPEPQVPAEAKSETPKPATDIPPGPVTSNVLPEMPEKVVYEGDYVKFPNLEAFDPDGDPLSYKFTPPLNKQGTWQTKRGDRGEYRVTITVSDGQNEQSQEVKIIVKKLNRAPVIKAVKSLNVREGETLDHTFNISDPDGDPVTVKISGWTESLPKTTGYSDAGDYTIVVNASDGELSSKITVPVKVLNVNRAPIIETIADKSVREGDLISATPVASDSDGDKITFTYSLPLNRSGEWQTKRGDIGSYNITVGASDGTTSTKTRFSIIVSASNHPPVLLGVENLSVKEGDTIKLGITASDEDNDNVTILYTGYMNSPEKKIGYNDQGTHDVVVRAMDGKDETRGAFKVVVEEVNRLPVFGPNSFK